MAKEVLPKGMVSELTVLLEGSHSGNIWWVLKLRNYKHCQCIKERFWCELENGRQVSDFVTLRGNDKDHEAGAEHFCADMNGRKKSKFRKRSVWLNVVNRQGCEENKMQLSSMAIKLAFLLPSLPTHFQKSALSSLASTYPSLLRVALNIIPISSFCY